MTAVHLYQQNAAVRYMYIYIHVHVHVDSVGSVVLYRTKTHGMYMHTQFGVDSDHTPAAHVQAS